MDFLTLYLKSKPAHWEKMGRFIFYFILTQIFFQVQYLKAATPNLKGNYSIVKKLNDNWLVYDNTFKSYVPYLPEKHLNFKALSQFLPIENYQNYNLVIYSSNESFLFLDNKYEGKLKEGQWKDISLDSLRLAKKNPKQLFLTVFSESPKFNEIELYVIHKTDQKIEAFIEENQQVALKTRIFNQFNNFSILVSILFLMILAFIYNVQDKLLLKFIDFKDLISINKRNSQTITSHPFEIGNLLFLLLVSLSLGLILMVIDHNYISILPQKISKNINPNFIGYIGQYLNLTFLLFLIFLLKYFLISIIGNLYKLDKVKNLHFFKNLQATTFLIIFSVFLLVFFSYLPYNTFVKNKSIYIAFVSGFYALRFVLLYFIILNSNPMKNLYLFSYLCIVEIIPFFIGLRIIS